MGEVTTPVDGNGRALCAKGIGLDEALPAAQAVLGNLRLWAKQHDQAIAAMARWLELAPNDADAHLGLAHSLTFAGRPGEALQYLNQSMRLNPNYDFLTLLTLGQANFMLGDHEEAIKALERSAIHNPNFMGTKIYLAAAYIEIGSLEKGRETFAGIEQLAPEFLATIAALPLRVGFESHAARTNLRRRSMTEAV